FKGEYINITGKGCQRVVVPIIADDVCRRRRGRDIGRFSKYMQFDAKIDCGWRHHSSLLAAAYYTYYWKTRASTLACFRCWRGSMMSYDTMLFALLLRSGM